MTGFVLALGAITFIGGVVLLIVLRDDVGYDD